MISFQTFQRFLLGFLLLMAVSFTTNGQARRSYDNISYTAIYYSPYVGDFYYSLGLHISKYSGDFGSYMGEDKTDQKTGLRYSLNVGYQVTNYVSLRFDYNRYKITDVADIVSHTDSTGTTTRPLPNFDAGKVDYSLNIVHDLFAKASIDNGERRFTPYGLAGFGFTKKGAGGLAAIVPVGAGIKYYIFHNLNIALEARAAVVLGDNFDGLKAGHKFDYYTNFGLKATWQRSYKFDYKRYKKKFYHL